jgi:hypothetical protein
MTGGQAVGMRKTNSFKLWSGNSRGKLLTTAHLQVLQGLELTEYVYLNALELIMFNFY